MFKVRTHLELLILSTHQASLEIKSDKGVEFLGDLLTLPIFFSMRLNMWDAQCNLKEPIENY